MVPDIGRDFDRYWNSRSAYPSASLLPPMPEQAVQKIYSSLQADTRYVLVPEAGLRQAHDDDRVSLPGVQWLALQQALSDQALFSETLGACIAGLNELKIQLRVLLHYHCGVKVLKTRQMMMDLQAF